MQVNLHEAKTNLSRLVERARKGEDVIIAKAGTPMVRLAPVDRPAKHILGGGAGRIHFQEGWDSPLSPGEMKELFAV